MSDTAGVVLVLGFVLPFFALMGYIVVWAVRR